MDRGWGSYSNQAIPISSRDCCNVQATGEGRDLYAPVSTLRSPFRAGSVTDSSISPTSIAYHVRTLMFHKDGHRVITPLSALLLLLASTSVLVAQSDVSALTRGLRWREVGPANPGGRITDVEGVEGRAHIPMFSTSERARRTTATAPHGAPGYSSPPTLGRRGRMSG